MALTSRQRRALPASAFVYPSKRSYPVPTKAQAAKAGIGERQRLAMHRNALARGAAKSTSGSYPTVAKKVRARAGGKVATVAKSKGTVSGPGMRKGKRR